MNRLHITLFAVCSLAAIWLSSLPFAGSTSLFLSPDETAVYQSAKAIAQSGDGGLIDERLRQFPWLHARSFVTLENKAVPVGFIGMPLLVSVAMRLGLPWLATVYTPISVLLVGYLFWRWTNKMPSWVRILTVLTWFTLPNVIVYANRGLFPNLITVCFTAIAAFLIWEKRSISRAGMSGVLFAIACAIRPIDAFWMIPWMACAWYLRQNREQNKENRFVQIWMLAAMCSALIAIIVHVQTLGSIFHIGYFLRDPVIGGDQATTTAQIETIAPVQNWFPFGIHPMHVWFNVREYLIGMLWPWVLIMCAAAVFQWKAIRRSPWTGLFVWTIASIVGVYGQGVYQDHIGVNVVSIGNSFLRYILPVAVFVPAGVALFLQKIDTLGIRSLKVICGSLIVDSAGLGFVMAFVWGSESIQASAATVRGYEAIQRVFVHPAQSDAVIFSDRSDKIFFTSRTKPVSPMPPLREIARFKQIYPTTQLYYFGRPLMEDALVDWAAHGLTLKAQFSAGNEVMYTIQDLGSGSIQNVIK